MTGLAGYAGPEVMTRTRTRVEPDPHTRRVCGTRAEPYQWEEWGPHNSCLLKTTTGCMDDVKVFGSTALFLSWSDDPLPDRALRIRFLDFGDIGVRKYMAGLSADKSQDHDIRLCLQHTYGSSRVFDSDDLVTYLPARVVETQTKLGRGSTSVLSSCLGDDCMVFTFAVSALRPPRTITHLFSSLGRFKGRNSVS